MGKKGRALREAKKESVTYTFTKAQLDARDRRLLEENIEKLKTVAYRQAEEELNRVHAEHWRAFEAEWETRQDLFNSGDFQNNMIEFVRLSMMIPFRVLVEHFGWTPAVRASDGLPGGRYRITRLHDLCAMALNEIAADEAKDIRAYSEECEKVTGISFCLEDKGWQ